MKTLAAILIVTTLTLVSLPNTSHADTVLCLKNKISANGTVNLKKAIKARTDTCLPKETKIDTALSATSILTLLLTVDGNSSSLDADTLDGNDSTSFASAANMSTAQSDISTLQSDVSTLQGDISTLESTSSSHTGSISSLNSGLATTDSDVEDLGLGPNLVRVGTANSQYTDLAEAAAYVASQARSATNRWVILVGPGQFELSEPLIIPTYTEIRGSGMYSTIVKSQDGIDVHHIIELSDYTGISDLTAKHSQTTSMGVTGVIDSQTTVDADPDNPLSFAATIRDCRIEMTSANPDVSVGLFVSSSDTRIERSEFLVSGSSSANYSIYSASGDGDLLVIDSQIYSSGSVSYAIINQQSGEVRISNSILSAATYAFSKSTGTALVRSSLLRTSGSGTCARASSDSVLSVAATTFDCNTHRLEATGGNVICANCNDENATELTSDCG